MYAIIEDSGTQIKVAPGQKIRVDTRALAPDAATLTFDRVMLIGDPENPEATTIGTPFVEGARVEGEIVGEPSEKVRVTRFKRRKGYTRVRGHRQHFLEVRITDIHAA